MGNSTGNALENLAGNPVGNAVGNLVGNLVGTLPKPIPKPFLKPIFKICKSSRSTSFSLVKIEYLFLKPIRNKFSHMTYKIKA